MPKLIFRVNADTSPVKKFRAEIEQIEKAMIRIKGENFSFDHWIKEFDRLKTELERKRAQIDNIKKDILTVHPIWEKKKFDSLNTELSKSSKERDALINDTISLSNKFGKAYDDLVATLGKAQKVTDEVTSRFIQQKQVVANLQSEVRSLNAEYRNANKGDKVGIRSQITSKQKELEQQRVTLNALKAEQERAKLAVKGLSDETRNYEKVVGKVSGAQAEANLVFSRFERSLLRIGGLATLQRFASDVVRVRGEFQQLEIAFETMLKSKDKASALMGQLIETAAKTPFDLQGIAQGAKQLLAYGTSAEDVNDTLVRLGNIASGLSIPLNDLVWLYGTTQVQGRLFTQDVRQFMGRGIPLVKELAKELGKTEQQINEMVTAGKIGFPEVEKVIRNMTNEGGQFYNLMEKQSASLTGQISNLGDAWDMMLNKIGAQTQGIASAGISTVSLLVENYEEVGKTILELVASYGAYKAILISIAALQRLNTRILEQAVIEKKLAAMASRTLSDAEAVATARTKLFTGAVKANTAALMNNPYILVAAMVVGLGYTIYKVVTAENEWNKAHKRLKEATSNVEKSLTSEVSKLTLLERKLSEAKKGTEEYNNIKKAIVDNYGQYYKGLDGEIDRVGDLSTAYGKLVENIRLSIGQRKFESFFKAEQDNLDKTIGEKLDKSYKTLIKKYGKDKGSRLYQQVFDYAVRGSEMSIDTWKQLDGATFSEWGFDNSPVGFSIRAVSSLVHDINRATQASTKALDEFKEKYQITEEDVTKILSGGDLSKDNKTTEENKTLKQLISDIKLAEQNIKSLRQQSQKGLIDTKKVDDAVTDLNILKKKYESMTGIKYGKSNTLSEKKLQQQKKLSDDLLSLRHKNHQEEIDLMEEGKKRKLKQIDADFAAQKTAIQKKSREFAEANKKAGITGLNANGLTAEQQAEIDKANKLNADSRAKAETDMYKAEAEAMRNYLKEYGTFQQQKLAIAEEYAEKIKKAQSEGERLSLVKQRDAALVNIDVQAAQQNIDWQSIFGDLGMMLKEQVQPTIDNLKTIIQSDEFQSSSVEDRQKIYDILSRLEQQSGALGNGLFKEVAMDLEIYRNSLNAYNKAQQREIEATNRLIEAKNKLKLAQENGGDVDAAKQAVKEAQEAFNRASESVKTLGDKASENAQTLKTSSEKARGAIEGLASGLSKLKSGSLQQAFEGVKDIGSKLSGKLGDAISNIDPTGIISGVLGLLDILKDGVSTIFVSLQDTLFGAVEGILNDVLSGDIVTKTWSNAMSHVGNILNTVTFGGFNSLFGIGGNAKKVQEAIDRLTDRNETLEKSIDRLSDVMEKEAGSKSISAYEQAYKYQEEHNKNTLQIAREQASYHNSHKSWQHYMGWSDEQLQWARENVDKNFSGTDSLWGLTPEQMKMLLSNADIYDHMKNAGAGGYGGRVMEKLEAYADNAEKLDELTDRINESLMQVSFDSLRDSFLDSLMDMDKDAKSFSEDFSEYMQRALLNFSMGEMFDEDLKEWYDGIAKLMKDQGGELTEQQLKDAREGYDKIVKDALNERDKLAQITGYTGGKDESTRKAAQKGIATASQDSIDELRGTMTNVQGHTYNINENTARIATGINTLTEHTKHLTCLADIDNTMQSLLTMRKESIEHLSNIAEYTSNLVEMKEFMRSMKAGIDTLNTKGLTLKR